MVSEEPMNSSTHGAFTFSVGVAFEIPTAGWSTNNELSNTNNESINPEKTEEVIQKDPSSCFAPFNLSNKLISFSWLRITYWEYINGGPNPEYKPNCGNQETSSWKNENMKISLNILWGCFKDSDSQFNCTPTAADNQCNQNSETPNNIGSPCNIIVGGVCNFVISSFEKYVETSSYESNQCETNSNIDDDSTNKSDHKKIQIGKYYSNKSSNKDNSPWLQDIISVDWCSFTINRFIERLFEWIIYFLWNIILSIREAIMSEKISGWIPEWFTPDNSALSWIILTITVLVITSHVSGCVTLHFITGAICWTFFNTNTLSKKFDSIGIITCLNRVYSGSIWSFWPVKKWVIDGIWTVTTSILIVIPTNQ